MILPPYLYVGATVAITCPAKKLEHPIEHAIALLESWGLKVKIGKTVHLSYFEFAGTDAERANEFQEFLEDDEVKAIFAARGGYGCVRIVDHIDFSVLKKNPKWIVGFSDITVFHSHLHQNIGIKTIHGIMPVNVDGATVASLNTLKKALFGQLKGYQYESTTIQNRSGQVNGVLIGGNLCVLTLLEHSVSEMDFRDKILFIEDVGEAHYAIDRMLCELERSGKLAIIKGLIVGAFNAFLDDEKSFGMDIYAMVLEKTKNYDYPIAFDFPAGHQKNNQSLILGAEILLEVKNKQVNIQFK